MLVRSSLLFLALTTAAHAQTGLRFDSETKLLPPAHPELSFDHNGVAVAIDGEWIASGALEFRLDPIGPRVGTVYVSRDAGGWAHAQQLLSSDAYAADPPTLFGASVDIDGTRMAIGATGPDPDLTRTLPTESAVYIFELVDGVWKETAKVVPAVDDTLGIRFGRDVSLDGDRLLVGATEKEDPGSGLNSGAAYVFELIGGVWTETDVLYPDTPVAGQIFGHAVDLQGDQLVVGAPLKANGLGTAETWTQIAGVWTPDAVLKSTTPVGTTKFGWDVDLDGDTLFVGAPNDDLDGSNSGLVHVHTGAGWGVESMIANPDGALGHSFGGSLAASDGRLAVGDTLNDAAAVDAGKVFLYARPGAGVPFAFRDAHTVADADPSDSLTHDLAFDGQTVVAGAAHDDGQGFEAGAAYALDLVWTCYEQAATMLGDPLGGRITGTAGDDVIVSFEGDDQIDGAGGDDLICAGDGDDVLIGGDGEDLLGGEGGHDQLFGGADDDSMSGGDGDDLLDGEGGDDFLSGDLGDDELLGGDGDDMLLASPGADTLTGDAGADFLDGGFDADLDVCNADGLDTQVRCP